MTKENTKPANQPVYRLGFAPYDGTDKTGQPKLGYPIEIGGAFQRTQSDKGLVAKFNIVPENMLNGGVLLLLPPREQKSENAELAL